MLNRKSIYVKLSFDDLCKRQFPDGDRPIAWEECAPICGIDWEKDARTPDYVSATLFVEPNRAKYHRNLATTTKGRKRRLIGFEGNVVAEINSESSNESTDIEMDTNRNKNRNKNKNKKRASNRGKSVKYNTFIIPKFDVADSNKITLIRSSIYGSKNNENPYFKLFDEHCRLYLIIVNTDYTSNLHCYEGLKDGDISLCNVVSIGFVRVAVAEETHFNIVYAPNTRCKTHKRLCKIFNYLSDKDRLYLGDGDKVVYKDPNKLVRADYSHYFNYPWYTLVTFKDSLYDTSRKCLSKRYHVSSTLLRVS